MSLPKKLLRLVVICGMLAAHTVRADPPAAPVDFNRAIRTPPAPDSPRINGPRVYGARPSHPFFYHLPVTGVRPITVTAKGLPAGLKLDPATGNITGEVADSGEHAVTFTATNAAGEATATLRIVIGKIICLTPPLGWNSWNCFHRHIDETKIRGAADAMVASGLIDHGWTYINMDDTWEGGRDAQGRIQCSAGFTGMKALADYIHGKGLKIGIYSSPGPITCSGVVASYLHEDQDAQTFADWGMDYLKYDWCSYGSIAALLRAKRIGAFLSPEKATQLETLGAEIAVLSTLHFGYKADCLPPTEAIKKAQAESASFSKDQVDVRLKEVRSQSAALIEEVRKAHPVDVAAIELKIDQEPCAKMRAALDKVDRDIVFSNHGGDKIWEWGAEIGCNTWRTTVDIGSTWANVEEHGFSQNGFAPYAGPGHWNDPDMLEIGQGAMTPDENYTHMTLWCMLASPLLIGCDMTKMTPFTISLFSNDEVLAVNQDALGKQGYRVKQDGPKEIWIKPLEDGSLAVAFFNRGEAAADVAVQWTELKLTGPQNIRDLWRQKELGVQTTGYSVNVAPHGVELFKVSSSK